MNGRPEMSLNHSRTASHGLSRISNLKVFSADFTPGSGLPDGVSWGFFGIGSGAWAAAPTPYRNTHKALRASKRRPLLAYVIAMFGPCRKGATETARRTEEFSTVLGVFRGGLI